MLRQYFEYFVNTDSFHRGNREVGGGRRGGEKTNYMTRYDCTSIMQARDTKCVFSAGSFITRSEAEFCYYQSFYQDTGAI